MAKICVCVGRGTILGEENNFGHEMLISYQSTRFPGVNVEIHELSKLYGVISLEIEQLFT